MYIRNENQFSSVFSLLSIFKALPQRLIMDFCSLDQNTFDNFVKNRTLFYTDSFFSFKRDEKPNLSLLKLAWSITALKKVNYYSFLLKSLNPAILCFLKKEDDGSSTSNALINYTLDESDMIKQLDLSDFSSLFFVVSDEDSLTSLTMWLPHLEHEGKTYVLKMSDVNSEEDLLHMPTMELLNVERN